MPPRQSNPFTTIRTEGGILPANFLQRVTEGNRDLDGIKGADYHLLPEERFNEVITRSWTRLLSAWETFSKAMGKLPESDLGTTITRERWLLPLFQELGYGRLQTSKSFEIDGKSYPISHMWKNCPIHIVSFRLDLDKRTAGTAGASRTTPHGLLQEFLNRSDDHLWGFVSNGLTLRILRDNVSMTRQSYVEFDLEAMMDGEVYADFALLWLLCHESRVEAERSEECWLERWCREAQERGTRALDTLRVGVEKAISTLGSGFLSSNRDFRDKLFSGRLDKFDYYRQLLRLVYRVLFLFVAEDRDLLLAPDADPKSRERFLKYYSISRIRTLALKQRGGKHGDLWHMLSLVFDALGSEHNSPALGISPLGSFLWSPDAIPDLAGCNLSNRDLLEAVRHLAFTVEGRIQRPVDYKNLGSEELGSIYESLLELHPDLNTDAKTFELKTAAGNERKTTGSYYTPTSLITCLLDSALDPVIDEASKKSNPEQEILNLKICDPACGSGHFLVAASHRVAKRLATIRTGDMEPSPDAHRDALRDVIARCIYGVDLNPMSVELCKVSLWMESMEPGKPLAFLDHHILCGNSLLGATPALLIGGIPDEAFKPIEGDDAPYSRRYKAINRQERKTKQMTLFAHDYEKWEHLNELATDLDKLGSIDDGSIKGVKEKQRCYEEMIKSSGYEHNRFLSDAWCAAFVWKKENRQGIPYPITEEVFRTIESNPRSAPAWLKQEVQRLAAQYRFFHWHMAFPDVFRVPDHSSKPGNEQIGWSGGFDVVLGNPPWERIKLQEKEWFAERRPDIAAARNTAERRQLIERLKEEDPSTYDAFHEALRIAEGESHLIRSTERYPLTAHGDINTYAIFSECFLSLLSVRGRAGIIVPSGIATDDSTKSFFDAVVSTKKLVSLLDFENRDGIFQGVHRSYKFCALTIGTNSPKAVFSFFLTDTVQMADSRRSFTLTPEEISLLNPNTRTCPIFRSQADAELTKKIYSKIPVLVCEGEERAGNPWGISIRRVFDMAKADVVSLCTRKPDDNLFMMFEAKMLHQYDHRWATYENKGDGIRDTFDDEKRDPQSGPTPRYWMPQSKVREVLNEKGWHRNWLLGWRDICRATDERTIIASVFPLSATDFTIRIGFIDIADTKFIACLLACLNSIVLDFIVRQKNGGTHLSDYITKQLPCLPPSAYSEADLSFIAPRTLELTYTSTSLQSWARDLGFDGKPFSWEPDRRCILRSELDAYYARLYGLNRDELRYILDPSDIYGEDYPTETFRVLKNNEIRQYGEYRTKRLVLEAWDRLG